MFRKALILLLIALPVLAMGCTSPTPTATPTAVPTATSPGATATPAASVSPTVTPAAGPKVLYNETIVVPAGGYVNYGMTLDYQKSANISVKTDGGPIDCLVVYNESLQAYKDNVAGATTYFGYQKLYPNIVDASNTFTSTNIDQIYYIILDNTGKVGEANAGRDVTVHLKVEQI
ncbi:MAG TPA: hypothetical protein VGJ92_13180 [Methanocella sp.]|jgi:hypothetical protein